MIDEIDLKILSIIQSDARQSSEEIARRARLEPAVVSRRILELERRGVISGYRAQLSPKALGLDLTAFVSVRTDGTDDAARTAARLADIPEVVEVHRIAGDDCYLAKVQVANTEALDRLLTEKLEAIESVCATQTTVVLKTVKENPRLPLKKLTAQATNI